MGFRENLRKRLEDKEFAKAFGTAQAKSSVALTLNEARNRAGMTQEELADRLNVSQEYIAKLESGEANPTIGRIGEILASMDFSLRTGFKPLAPDDDLRKQERQKAWQEAAKDPLFVRDADPG